MWKTSIRSYTDFGCSGRQTKKKRKEKKFNRRIIKKKNQSVADFRKPPTKSDACLSSWKCSEHDRAMPSLSGEVPRVAELYSTHAFPRSVAGGGKWELSHQEKNQLKTRGIKQLKKKCFFWMLSCLWESTYCLFSYFQTVRGNEL